MYLQRKFVMEDSLQSSILIVDDSTTNIRVVSNMISELGHKIHIAKNGFQALKLLTKFNPSVILMDIKMPEMDGFECCQRIKKSASRANVPVIFLSGSDDDRDRRKAKLVGGNGYLTKPINQQQLLSEIDFHLPWS